MARSLCLAVLAAFALAGCAQVSESRLNPFNWFGQSAEQREVAAGERALRPLVPPERVIQRVDARPLVQRISQLEVTPANGGIIVRATGQAAQAGAFSAQLTRAATTASTITLEFRAFQGTGSGDGRVTVARFISNSDLAGARTITVRAASNALTRRR
ncbi:MAG: hypothetical protein AAF647_05480 [Pseudomonadota bacterium]